MTWPDFVTYFGDVGMLVDPPEPSELAQEAAFTYSAIRAIRAAPQSPAFETWMMAF